MLNVYLSTTNFKNKPNKKEIEKLSKTIINSNVSIHITDFAEQLTVLGKTVVLCQLSFPTLSKSTPIISQELVMLDFDNKDSNNIYTLDDLENDEFIQNNALFYYKTFSDENSDVDKFRVVFQLPYKITNNKEIEDIYQDLFKRYPMSDTSIGQTSRMFFGSNQGYEVIDFDNRLELTQSLETKKLSLISEIYTPNYVLLKQGKLDEIRNKLGNTYSGIFPDYIVASNFYKNIDIKEFLELPDTNPFFDILHKEDNPSASVFYSKEYKIYLYKCFSSSNKFTGDLIVLLKKYLGFTSLLKILKILNYITNSEINIDTDLGEAKLSALDLQKSLKMNTLKLSYPELNSYIYKYKQEIDLILDLMFDYTYIDKEKNEIVYLNYISIDSLTKIIQENIGYKISKDKVWSILNIIIVTEIIQKLPKDKIPQELYNNLIKSQLENPNKIRTSNVYSPKLDIDKSQEIAKILKDNNITVSSLSFDTIYRLFGEEKANKDFPQAYEPLAKKGLISMSEENTLLPVSSLKYEKIITKLILKEIKTKKYCFEQDIISELSELEKISIKTSKKIFDKIKITVYSDNKLTCVRANNKLLTKFKIKTKTNKYIIFTS